MTTNKCTTPQREGQINSSINGLLGSIEHLENFVNELFSRLTPVLSPQSCPNSEGSPVGNEKRISEAPISERVLSGTGRITSVNHVLQDILDRLEI